MPDATEDMIKTCFYDSNIRNGQLVGGKAKRDMFRLYGQYLIEPGFRFTTFPLQVLFESLFTAIGEWIAFIEPAVITTTNVAEKLKLNRPSLMVITAMVPLALPFVPHDIKIQDYAFMISVFQKILAFPEWPDESLDPPRDSLRKRFGRKLISSQSSWQHNSQLLGDRDTQDREKKSKSSTSMGGPEQRCGNMWSCTTRRYHHRFLVEHIAKQIDKVTCSKQLVQVAFDGLSAQSDALTLCGYVHQDITSKNLLVGEEGRGVLNDWDLAKELTDLNRPRRHEKTGTWAFMSCLLLSNHHAIHTIQDDMESLVHVLLYHSLRYFPHSMPEATEDIINTYFYDSTVRHGRLVGGENKQLLFLLEGEYLIERNFGFTATPLQVLFEYLFEAIGQWIRFVAPPKTKAKDRLNRFHPTAPAITTPPGVTDIPDGIKLRNYDFMKSIFQKILEEYDWPPESLDRPKDALPRRSSLKRGH
ncbi:hypothetical protein H0H81_011127 [Sphagnurus paluster]|uniref:Fungal-type protein kinase domain-containing protein n=1 Tax=Sphagnurus paluster TaxID=117069 RepID=A0A9P7GQU2_9AGAR|nr:hypothetical protein H0H81_011127 [Sphagnurus paluster]